ncbi:MAG: peptidoglycan-binding protein [Cyanobacteria bacterium P01_D01_bin.156]
MALEKAKLIEIEWSDGHNEATPKDGFEPVEVQFNPASLKVSYSNQVQTNDQSTSSTMQYVGKGDSKLAVELLFDVSGAGATDVKDVRRMTQRVAYFMSTSEDTSGEETKYTVPGLRFQWGSFFFDGILGSMDENLELWSEDGNPLRATVSLSMSQPGIQFKFSENTKATPPPQAAPASGTQPLTAALQGGTLQGMVSGAGGADWKAVAALNGIENPRNLPTGTLVNLNARATVGSGGVSASFQAGGG